jgi:hypothetical protein
LLVVGRVVDELFGKVVRVKTYQPLHVASMSGGEQIQTSTPKLHISRVESVLKKGKKSTD